MLEACQFLVTKATEFYERYASQGRWTMYVHCMEEARFRGRFCEAMGLLQLGVLIWQPTRSICIDPGGWCYELGGGKTLSVG